MYFEGTITYEKGYNYFFFCDIYIITTIKKFLSFWDHKCLRSQARARFLFVILKREAAN